VKNRCDIADCGFISGHVAMKKSLPDFFLFLPFSLSLFLVSVSLLVSSCERETRLRIARAEEAID